MKKKITLCLILLYIFSYKIHANSFTSYFNDSNLAQCVVSHYNSFSSSTYNVSDQAPSDWQNAFYHNYLNCDNRQIRDLTGIQIILKNTGISQLSIADNRYCLESIDPIIDGLSDSEISSLLSEPLSLNLSNNSIYALPNKLLLLNLSQINVNHNQILYISKQQYDHIRNNNINFSANYQIGDFIDIDGYPSTSYFNVEITKVIDIEDFNLVGDNITKLYFNGSTQVINNDIKSTINLANYGNVFEFKLYDSNGDLVDLDILNRVNSAITIDPSSNILSIDQHVFPIEGEYELFIKVINGDFKDTRYYYKFNTKFLYYNLSYSNNGGKGIINDTSFRYNRSFKLNVNSFIREGYKFIGWNSNQVEADKGIIEYVDNANITLKVRENTTLYAVWDKINDYSSSDDSGSSISNKDGVPITGNNILSNVVLSSIISLLFILGLSYNYLRRNK